MAQTLSPPPPMVIGFRVNFFLTTGQCKPPIFCGACCPQVEFPTQREPLWAGELPEDASCRECGIELSELEPEGAIPSGEWVTRIEDLITEQARVNVDAAEGCTAELADDAEAHRELYRREELRLRSQVSAAITP